MNEIMFKVCELCGETYHVDEMVDNEEWCVYCNAKPTPNWEYPNTWETEVEGSGVASNDKT